MFDMSVLFESLNNGTVLTKHEYKKKVLCCCYICVAYKNIRLRKYTMRVCNWDLKFTSILLQVDKRFYSVVYCTLGVAHRVLPCVEYCLILRVQLSGVRALHWLP
jgi:hypothetical protein